MKTRIRQLVILSFVAFFFAAFDAAAQQTAKNVKAEQTRAWKQFQQAVAKRDKKALAAMIEFPFEASIVGEKLDFRIESEAQFIENFDKIFTAPRRAKITRGKMWIASAEDGEFYFEMQEGGGYHVFTFRKTIGGAYKLVGTLAAG